MKSEKIRRETNRLEWKKRMFFDGKFSRYYSFDEYSVIVTNNSLVYSKVDEKGEKILMPVAGDWNNSIVYFTDLYYANFIELNNGIMVLSSTSYKEHRGMFDFIALGYGIDVPAKPIYRM